VVMGLQAEAGCLGPAPEDGIVTYVSGGSALRARTGAEQLRAKGIDGLVSFGLAIGLAPVLRPGDLVVGESVVLPAGDTVATDPAWRAAVLRRLGAAGLKPRSVRILGGDEPLTSAGAKRQAFQTTLAAALDTESLRLPRLRPRPACRCWCCGRSPSRPNPCGRRSRLRRPPRPASRGALPWSPA
jgi:adenosylhomocysteine nucleosidase